MNELKIVAKIIVKKEYQQELEGLFRKTVDQTRKEEGNISYELCQGVENKLEYTILENWKSQDAIDYHNQTSHFLAFKEGIDGKIDGLSIDVIRKIY